MGLFDNPPCGHIEVQDSVVVTCSDKVVGLVVEAQPIQLSPDMANHYLLYFVVHYLDDGSVPQSCDDLPFSDVYRSGDLIELVLLQPLELLVENEEPLAYRSGGVNEIVLDCETKQNTLLHVERALIRMKGAVVGAEDY